MTKNIGNVSWFVVIAVFLVQSSCSTNPVQIFPKSGGTDAALKESKFLAPDNINWEAFDLSEGRIVCFGKDELEDTTAGDIVVGMSLETPGCYLWSGGYKFHRGLIDMGEKKMSEVKTAPNSYYSTVVSAREGHTYCVYTRDRNKYGKIYVKKIDYYGERIVFDWEYQPDGSREF